jgi:hypothetical protein
LRSEQERCERKTDGRSMHEDPRGQCGTWRALEHRGVASKFRSAGKAAADGGKPPLPAEACALPPLG